MIKFDQIHCEIKFENHVKTEDFFIKQKISFLNNALKYTKFLKKFLRFLRIQLPQHFFFFFYFFFVKADTKKI